MPLTDTAIRAAKPSEKQQKLFDGSGLYLLIFPSGSKDGFRRTDPMRRASKTSPARSAVADAAPRLMGKDKRQGLKAET